MSAKREITGAPGKVQVRPLTVSKPELLSGNSDAAFRELIHDMLAVAARTHDIRNGLGAHVGLSGSQYTILVTIDHNQDHASGVGVNQVADHLHLSGAFVTLEVNKLVEKKLVGKTVNPGDRRRVLLRTTAKGQSLLTKLSVLQQPVNDALFDTLSHSEFLILRDLMAKLVITSDRSFNLLKYLTHGDEAASRKPT